MPRRKNQKPNKLTEQHILEKSWQGYRTPNKGFVVDYYGDSSSEAEDEDVRDNVEECPPLKRRKMREPAEPEDMSPLSNSSSTPETSTKPRTDIPTFTATNTTAANATEPLSNLQRNYIRKQKYYTHISPTLTRLVVHLKRVSQRIHDDSDLIELKRVQIPLVEISEKQQLQQKLQQVLVPVLQTLRHQEGIKSRITFMDSSFQNIVTSIPELDTTGDGALISTQYFISLCFCAEKGIVFLKAFPNDDGQCISLVVYLVAGVLEKDTNTHHIRSEKETFFIRHLLEWAFPGAVLVPEVCDSQVQFSPSTIYDAIRPFVKNYKPVVRVEHPSIRTELFSHQRAAVSWMIERENVATTTSSPQEVTTYWRVLKTDSGCSFAFNMLTGALASNVSLEVADVKGGVLADEMGLGKTVEVISLVLLHQRPPSDLMSLEEYLPKVEEPVLGLQAQLYPVICYCGSTLMYTPHQMVFCQYCRTWQHSHCVGYSQTEGNYMCPTCCDKHDTLLPIKGTLIIVPAKILHQWVEEISKHLVPDTLKVLVYTGVQRPTPDPSTGLVVVRPTQFISYDIVLTTFETLQSEFFHLPQDNTRLTRFTKQYRVLPTPLSSVSWWRVCVDESQTLKEGSTKAASLAADIIGVNRWGVSGTPIAKSLDDLLGLLQFLRLEPYCSATWWRRAISIPYTSGVINAIERLHALMRRILWRNSKQDVEVKLSEPIEIIHKLTLSELERFLYERRLRQCTQKTLNLLSSSRYDPKLVPKLMNSILPLRQACVHPQLGNRTGLNTLKQATMSMSEMLDQLLVKQRLEAEDAQRQIAIALNGMAGISMLENEWERAASFYREVLKEKEVAVDIPVRIHAAHHLQTVLQYHLKGDKEELQKLKELEDDLTKLFLMQHINRLADSRATVSQLENELKEQSWSSVTNDDVWWAEVIRVAGTSVDIVDRVKAELASMEHPTISVAERFDTNEGLTFTIYSLLEELESKRKAVRSTLEKICLDNPTDKMVAEVTHCPGCRARHRANNQQKTRCAFCKAEEKINAFERALFLFLSHRIRLDTNEQEGLSRRESELERILTTLHSIAQATSKEKKSNISREIIEAGAKTLKAFGILKKEAKAFWVWWQRGYQMVLGVDELRQCTERLQLREPGEEILPGEENYKLLKEQLPVYYQKFNADRMIGEAQLKVSLTHLSYLEKLRHRESSASDTCPICTEPLKDDIVLWTCGHIFCPSCVKKLKDSTPAQQSQIKCPNCRARMNKAEICTVSRSAHPVSQPAEPTDSMVGRYGTKIAALVRIMKDIFIKEPDAKVLIFSQWDDILTVISQALANNGISYVQLKSGSKERRLAIQKFRTDKSIRAMGLNIVRANQGLNLIEANHVFIVEPNLLPAQEQQAIGRVYRIGQTRQTHVHRLIVENTVEEQVYELAKQRVANNTISSDTTGFGTNKKERDLFTAQDIASILGLDTNEQKQQQQEEEQDTTSEQNRAELQALYRNTAYWNAKVWMVSDSAAVPARLMPRNLALAILMNQATLQKSLNKDSPGENKDEPQEQVELYGKMLPREVAERVAALKVQDEEEEDKDEENGDNDDASLSAQSVEDDMYTD